MTMMMVPVVMVPVLVAVVPMTMVPVMAVVRLLHEACRAVVDTGVAHRH